MFIFMNISLNETLSSEHKNNIQMKRNKAFMTIMDKSLHMLIGGDLFIGSSKPETDMQEYLMKEFAK